MTSWQAFTEQAPQLASFGEARFRGGVAYLGTIRADGSPRVHPVTPLHCAVENSDGGEGEFYVRGRATFNEDPNIREQAIQAASYRYILFVFSVEFAFMNVYVDGESNIQRWQSS